MASGVRFPPRTTSREEGPGRARLGAERLALGAAAAERGAEVVRLRPASVMVLSSDRHLRIVLELLLARRGCSVMGARLLMPAGTVAADVVVVDGGESDGGLARARQIARALAPAVGVVLLAPTEPPDLEGVVSLARWGAFPELFAAIARAERRRLHVV